MEHRVRNPVNNVPQEVVSQDLAREKVQEQDTVRSVKSHISETSSDHQPEDEASVDRARRRLQEYADTADHDSAFAPPPPSLEDLEYRRSAQADHDEFFNRWAKIRRDFREPLAEFLGVRSHSSYKVTQVFREIANKTTQTFLAVSIGLSGNLNHLQPRMAMATS